MMRNTSEWPADDVETLIANYGDILYRLCLIMLKNESDAEDVVQETYIKYFQKTPLFESKDHQKAWLIRVATNKCRDTLRFRVRHPQIEDDDIDRYVSDSSDSGILEALTMVPEKFRLVLTLYYIEEYRTEDIAKIIGRSSSAVKMRLQKGRKLLEEIYRKEYL
jgi:RNA polymerase sigma-70 factor (ECF subfamily)